MRKQGESEALLGCGVLVTRPAGRNEGLSTGLNAHGAHVFEFPLLCIEACALDRPLVMADDTRPQWFIFTSRNAVDQAFLQWPQLVGLTSVAKFSAVGAATAKALHDHGISDVVLPQGRYSSEGLLDLLDFQRAGGKRMMIVTGQAGRSLLADTLRARGAQVECLEVYQRRPSNADLQRYWRNHGGSIKIIIITSVQALLVLKRLAGQALYPAVCRCALVAASARIAQEAIQLGFNAPVEIARQVSDASLLEACQRLWRIIGQ